MDGVTRTYCDEAGDYVVSNVISPKDLVSRPDNNGQNFYHHLQASIMTGAVAYISSFIDFVRVKQNRIDWISRPCKVIVFELLYKQA